MLSGSQLRHLQVLLEGNEVRIRYKAPVFSLQLAISSQCLTYRNHHTKLHRHEILQARLQELLFRSGHCHNRM